MLGLIRLLFYMFELLKVLEVRLYFDVVIHSDCIKNNHKDAESIQEG